MKTIDLADILTSDLKFRMRAQDLKLINVPSDIKAMLDAVSRTQVRANVIPSQSQEVSFKNVKEFLNYFSTLVL